MSRREPTTELGRKGNTFAARTSRTTGGEPGVALELRRLEQEFHGADHDVPEVVDAAGGVLPHPAVAAGSEQGKQRSH